jgi:hypothetical protein
MKIVAVLTKNQWNKNWSLFHDLRHDYVRARKFFAVVIRNRINTELSFYHCISILYTVYRTIRVILPIKYKNIWQVLYNRSRSGWQRRIRHELSSPARTMWSWVRNHFDAWISVWVNSESMLFSVQVAALRRADPWSKVSSLMCIY